jgi:hypothetical protein
MSDNELDAAAQSSTLSGTDAVDSIYGPMDNISKRFPGLKGLRLQQKVWKLYIVEGRQHETVPFFDDAGEPAMVMHPLNMRHQQQVLTKS